MILGITGHRPHPHLGGYDIPNLMYTALKEAIKEMFVSLNPDKIISGMAQGTDQYSVEVAIELEIPFVAALPCDNQDAMWPQKAKDRFQYLLSKASEIHNVSPGGYTKSCMHERDRWIVNNSDALLAVWNGQNFGGTFATVRMAQKRINKGDQYLIHRINPDDLVI